MLFSYSHTFFLGTLAPLMSLSRPNSLSNMSSILNPPKCIDIDMSPSNDGSTGALVGGLTGATGACVGDGTGALVGVGITTGCTVVIVTGARVGSGTGAGVGSGTGANVAIGGAVISGFSIVGGGTGGGVGPGPGEGGQKSCNGLSS